MLPLSYTNDVLNFDAVGGTALGNVAQAGFTCDDIRFKGISEPLYPATVAARSAGSWK